MSRQAVILAGGLATRLEPITRTVPKSLIEVAGRPFIDLQLERLRESGYDRVVLCIGHLGGMIRNHVGNGTAHGLRVEYSEDGPALLGTGGALRAAMPLLDEECLITYGDSWLPVNYSAPLDELRANADCDGVMSVYENAGRWDSSNVVLDGEWIGAYAKGTHDPRFNFIDYGAFALLRPVIGQLPDGARCGVDEILGALASRRRLRAHVAQERFFEIGSPEGLSALEKRLSSR